VTVSALNRAVAGLLSRNFDLVRVSGEIANLSRAASGHWYFTLKDATAQVRCAMFRARNVLVGFTPGNGDQVVVLAQVGLYEARGDFQLNVESLQRAGQGRLFEEFLRIKAKLAAEGLFDDSRKRRLPAFPRALGVVTSLQAAALRDVLATLRRRAPHLRLIVYPVPVQGEGAGTRIAQMLRLASQRREVDTLLLVRGGGSIEDLWAFNEEVVARAIRAATIPVVVGVGHESDFTMADFAADLRAPTPTAAAELAAPELSQLLETVRGHERALTMAARRRLQGAQQRLDYAARALASPRAPTAALNQRVASLRQRMGHVQMQRLAAERLRIAAQTQSLLRLGPRIDGQRAGVERCRWALTQSILNAHQRDARRLEQSVAKLRALDPKAVLARGYAMVTTPQGAVVRNAEQLNRGDALRVRWARDGAIVHIEALEFDADTKVPE
jgi:exodeoxyribonuclease VII large subunit